MKTTHDIHPSSFHLFKLKIPLLALILGVAIEGVYFASYYILGVLGASFLWIHWPALKATQYLCAWIASEHTPAGLIFFSVCLIECWMILFVGILLFRYFRRTHDQAAA